MKSSKIILGILNIVFLIGIISMIFVIVNKDTFVNKKNEFELKE
tara:strand:- start:12623 stop:12754 length:132 start_codon:yes stop_codon:yes gene_type:complete